MSWDIECERSAMEYRARREFCINCGKAADTEEMVWVECVPFCEDCAEVDPGGEPTEDQQAKWIMSVTFAPAVVSNALELPF